MAATAAATQLATVDVDADRDALRIISRSVAEMKELPYRETRMARLGPSARDRRAGLGRAIHGCAAAPEHTSMVTAASMRADEQPSEERQPEGWPPYYPPRLVRDLAGTDVVMCKNCAPGNQEVDRCCARQSLGHEPDGERPVGHGKGCAIILGSTKPSRAFPHG